MFFIVSTGRSGTNAIARALSLIHGCVCLHEPPPQLIIESSAYRYEKVSADEIRDILAQTRKPVLDGGVYCESNQTLSLIIPILADTFPQARYIWLIRNGMDVVASAVQKQWYTGHSENHDRYEDCPPIEKAWIDGRIRADLCGEMTCEEWNSLSRFAKCCWYWAYVNKLIESDLEKCAPGKHTLVKLEELDSRLPGLLKWMGLKAAIVPKTRRTNTAKRTPYHWTGWTEEEKKIFTSLCGEFMDRYYPEWRTPEGDFRSITYDSGTGFMDKIKTNDKLVNRINRFFARNSVK